MRAFHLVDVLILSILSLSILALESEADARAVQLHTKPSIRRRNTDADSMAIRQRSSLLIPRTINRFRADKQKKAQVQEEKTPQSQQGKKPQAQQKSDPQGQEEWEKFRLKPAQHASSSGKPPDDFDARLANLKSNKPESPSKGRKSPEKPKSDKAESSRSGSKLSGEHEDEFRARLDKLKKEKPSEQAQHLQTIQSLQPPDLTKSPSAHDTVSYHNTPSLFRPSSPGIVPVQHPPTISETSRSSKSDKGKCLNCFGGMFKKNRNRRRYLGERKSRR